VKNLKEFLPLSELRRYLDYSCLHHPRPVSGEAGICRHHSYGDSEVPEINICPNCLKGDMSVLYRVPRVPVYSVY
jgi:hypothetical protein